MPPPAIVRSGNTALRCLRPSCSTSPNLTPLALVSAPILSISPISAATTRDRVTVRPPDLPLLNSRPFTSTAAMGDTPQVEAAPAALTALFEKAESEFPPRFREHGWYIAVIASLIGSGQQKLAGHLYTHLVSQPQYQTPEQRQALVRRLREAMVKCIIINGIPVVIEAITAVSDIERPEDRDLSCTREDWQIGPETTERAANVLKVLYKSEKGGHVKTLQAHKDIPWISVNVSYGLFLSDHRILSMQETELVVLPAIMTQNLRGPTYWHLRACLRVGMEVDEVEAIHKVIEAVAAYGGKTLDVQRVADVTDA